MHGVRCCCRLGQCGQPPHRTSSPLYFIPYPRCQGDFVAENEHTLISKFMTRCAPSAPRSWSKVSHDGALWVRFGYHSSRLAVFIRKLNTVCISVSARVGHSDGPVLAFDNTCDEIK